MWGKGGTALYSEFVPHQKAVPVYVGSGCECNEQSKGERFKAAKCREMFPLSLTSFDSSPAGGGAFWHCTQGLILYFKLSPFTGKVDTNGVSGRKGDGSKLPSYFTVPPQLRLRSAAPPQAVEPFGALYKLTY